MDIKNMSGIYLFCENKVLMMKRIKKDYNGEGKYFSIGGKFEKEELNNPKKCILRELEEEFSIVLVFAFRDMTLLNGYLLKKFLINLYHHHLRFA